MDDFLKNFGYYIIPSAGNQNMAATDACLSQNGGLSFAASAASNITKNLSLRSIKNR